MACDKRLLRLISYLHATKEKVGTNYVGDEISQCRVHLFVDASFAGDLEDSKSTSGAIIVLVGPHTWVPITWLCKKQGAVSHSSTEAEVIALESSLRMEGIPSLMLWDLVAEVFNPHAKCVGTPKQNKSPQAVNDMRYSIIDLLLNVDFVP